MKELYSISDIGQAKTLLHPLRVSLLSLLRNPSTCLELSNELGLSQQRINNHLKELLKSGLIEKVESRQKRNLIEAVYQSVGKVYWFSPKLSREKKIKKVQQEMSLHNLLEMSEKLQEDTSVLLGKSQNENIPSIGVTADIELSDEKERETFSKELIQAMHAVLEKYQTKTSKSEKYTAMIVCYPNINNNKKGQQ